ncbi:MAG: TonB-dependent receptor [Acidobacteriaceae bacterium]|nr:TonB-dependent receptor [Acidobacteriaceae bacterium]
MLESESAAQQILHLQPGFSFKWHNGKSLLRSVRVLRRGMPHTRRVGRLTAKALALVLWPLPLLGQTVAVHGTIIDPTGAVVPNATVTITATSGVTHTTASDRNGNYFFSQLKPGNYTVQASAPDMALNEPILLTLSSQSEVLNLTLKVQATKQNINVEDESGPKITAENSGNASSVVLQGKDLDALGDSQEDLAADLQALAGPSAGPSGGALYVDGFSGGALPSKESIREVKVNQNPFSPEYDKLGYGRIEIITKPGTEKYHGLAYFNFGDSIWNSRDPYSQQKAPFLLREYGGDFGGPLSHRLSFFFNVDGAAIDNGANIDTVTLDPQTLAITPFTSVFTVPQRRIIVTPRTDYRLNSNHTLSFRYRVEQANIDDSGVGSLNLASLSNHVHFLSNTFQASETATLGSHIVNQSRFQFFRIASYTLPNTPGPEIQVLGAFNTGGSQLGPVHDTQNNFEFQNYTTISHNTHTLHFGARVRDTRDANFSRANFAGTFTFGGGLGPEVDSNNNAIPSTSIPLQSIERYRRTLLFQHIGETPAEIRALGGGATQFSVYAGIPQIYANQADVGAFFGDEWHVKPGLIVSPGLRYEWQTNIGDLRDLAPRLGVAWQPGSKSNFVLRAGFGIFYDRFALANVVNARRFNGELQQQLVIYNPNSFPMVPPITAPTTIQELSPSLRAPLLMQSALTIERQLIRRTTVAITYTNSHGLHQLRTLDMNAPLPGTFNPSVPGSGVFPLGRDAPVFQMVSDGLYNQNQLIVNVNSKVSSQLSFFGTYTLNRALSNTDGLTTTPANPYNFSGEYGPAITDIRNSFVFGGTFERWKFRVAPLIRIFSGPPFDITVGNDVYGDTLFNARPGIPSGRNKPGLIQTQYGLLDPNPSPDQPTLSRNYGRGPGYVLFNLRVTKLFEFGRVPAATVRSSGTQENNRYTLSIAASIRNIINRDNPGPIVGDITSPFFGRANQSAGASGFGGTGFLESANNRRLELQTKFIF